MRIFGEYPNFLVGVLKTQSEYIGSKYGDIYGEILGSPPVEGKGCGGADPCTSSSSCTPTLVLMVGEMITEDYLF